MPGAERRTAPGTCYSEDGGQLLLRFYEAPTEGERLTLDAEKPLPPRRGQKPVENTPLFRR